MAMKRKRIMLWQRKRRELCHGNEYKENYAMAMKRNRIMPWQRKYNYAMAMKRKNYAMTTKRKRIMLWQ